MIFPFECRLELREAPFDSIDYGTKCVGGRSKKYGRKKLPAIKITSAELEM
jgi:hypothetical protein